MKSNQSKLSLTPHPQGIVVNGAILIPYEHIERAREWVYNNFTPEHMNDDIPTDRKILKVVNRFYDGGLQAFLLTTVN